MNDRSRRREIDRAGVQLSYLGDDADGPVVVLLHGLAGTSDEFTATARDIRGPYRFVLSDLRGHGGLVPPKTTVFAAKSMFSPAEQAEFVAAARPGARHVVLRSGSHDAHLDATTEWAQALHHALADKAGT